MITTILQDIGAGLDVWQSILDIGGLVGLLLAIAVFVLWRKLDAKEKELAVLNKQLQETGSETIRVMTSVERYLDSLHDNLGAAESRILSGLDNKFQSIKELIHAYKEKINDRTHPANG